MSDEQGTNVVPINRPAPSELPQVIHQTRHRIVARMVEAMAAQPQSSFRMRLQAPSLEELIECAYELGFNLDVTLTPRPR